MAEPERIRVDKWLWHARFFKTRTLAAKIVTSGAVRVNGNRIAKASVLIGPGDTLTFVKEDDVRVIRMIAPGARRGPAPEAQALYEDLAPPEPKARKPEDQHPEATQSGRPTKRDRRALDALKKTGY